MSRENVEIATLITDAFNRRDIDAMADLTTAELEWTSAMGGVEGEVFRGRAGFETYLARLGETWEEYRLAVDEYRDLGGTVVVLGRVYAQGKGSGAPVESPFGSVLDLRDGRIFRHRAFLDHGEALRAAGLNE